MQNKPVTIPLILSALFSVAAALIVAVTIGVSMRWVGDCASLTATTPFCAGLEGGMSMGTILTFSFSASGVICFFVHKGVSDAK